jgi:glycerol-3-phosphate dehydrogenase (NAD(P)+)
MTPQGTYDIGVVGAGAWGTTLAMHLGLTGRKVLLWAFEPDVVSEINSDHTNSTYLKGFKLPEEIFATSDLADIGVAPRLIIVVPSSFYQRTVESLFPHLHNNVSILSATKGFLNPELKRPSELLIEKAPGHPIGVLSGPNLSREIASRLPAISLVASKDENLIREYQTMLSTERFRVYGGSDMTGTELGGALKNIIAIAAGMVDGLHLGENTMAALITRGLTEMIKLGKILGAEERTFYGVSGLGDLICTCQSPLSRNNLVGKRIAEGEKLDHIRASISAIPEGIETSKNVHKYAQAHNLDLPITQAVHRILFESAAPEMALRELMTRTYKME